MKQYTSNVAGRAISASVVIVALLVLLMIFRHVDFTKGEIHIGVFSARADHFSSSSDRPPVESVSRQE